MGEWRPSPNPPMGQLLSLYLQIALLRAGPQRLPPSRLLLVLLLASHALFGYLLGALDEPAPYALVHAALMTLLMVSVTHALLLWCRHLERLAQTLSALAGTDLLLGLISLPIQLWSAAHGEPQVLKALLVLGLLVWSVVITAHILRHALDLAMVQTVPIALSYTLLSYMLAVAAMPPAG